MRKGAIFLFLLFFFTLPTQAAELPDELQESLPPEAVEFAQDGSDLTGGIARIALAIKQEFQEIFHESMRGAVLLLLVVLLCGMTEGFGAPLGSEATQFVPLVGALGITAIAAGDLGILIGLGTSTMEELSVFSKILMPTMAAAMASIPATSAITAPFLVLLNL